MAVETQRVAVIEVARRGAGHARLPVEEGRRSRTGGQFRVELRLHSDIVILSRVAIFEHGNSAVVGALVNGVVEHAAGGTGRAVLQTDVVDKGTGDAGVVGADVGGGRGALLGALEDEVVDVVVVALRVGQSEDPVVQRVVEVVHHALVGKNGSGRR